MERTDSGWIDGEYSFAIVVDEVQVIILLWKIMFIYDDLYVFEDVEMYMKKKMYRRPQTCVYLYFQIHTLFQGLASWYLGLGFGCCTTRLLSILFFLYCSVCRAHDDDDDLLC